MRKYYLYNIRWATVLLILVYHVFYLFNNAGVLGAIGDHTGIASFDVLLYAVYPWFMVLLFLIAGISARYSLQKRSGKEFIKERVTKLLVPSTLGLFVYHFITGYFNIRIGGGLAYIPKFLLYPISVISGTGPLWFIQMLFLFSACLILIYRLDHEKYQDKLWTLCGKSGPVILLLLVLPVWGASFIGNLPVLTTYRFGIYGLAFLLGYFIFSHDEVQDKVEKMHIPMLLAAVLLGVFYVRYYFGENYTTDQCLQSIFTNVYLWIAVLAILGCAKAWFNKVTKVTQYLTSASFGFYIVHYPILIVTCYILYYYFKLPLVLNYVIALLTEVILTVGVYELFRRIPVIRYLVLGIRKTKKGAETND